MSTWQLKSVFAIELNLYIGDECTRSKPFPDPYLKALSLLEQQQQADAANTLQSIDKSNVIVIEDSRAGIQAGVAASIRVIGITTTLSEEELLDAGAFMTIDDFDDEKLWELVNAEQ